jgi:hypothetical protein
MNAPLIDVIWLDDSCLREQKMKYGVADETVGRNTQVNQVSKSREWSTGNRCDQVAVQVPEQAICENQALMWQFSVTYNLVRLPSPVNAPLAIDVIWLTLIHLQ